MYKDTTSSDGAKTTPPTTGATVPSAAPFDPNRFLVNLRGRPYLEVKYRLLWLRAEHPEAVVQTELMAHDRERRWALFRATVTVVARGPDGPVLASATGWGQEDAQGFGDYLEKAETKALGRALAALGYGTQFCEDHEDHQDHGDHEVGAASFPSRATPEGGRAAAPASPSRSTQPRGESAHAAHAAHAAGSAGAGGGGDAPGSGSSGSGRGDKSESGLAGAVRALGGVEIGRVRVEHVAATPDGAEVYLVDGRVHATRHYSPTAGTYYRAVATCPHGHNAYPMARIDQNGALTPWRHRLPDGSLCTAPADWTTTAPEAPEPID